MGQDDSARRRADEAEAVAASERLALEAAGVGTWAWDLATGAVTWSPVHAALWGYAPGTFPGTADAFFARVHPDDRAALVRTGDEARACHEPFHATYRVLHTDGGLRWMESHGSYLFDEEGRPTRIVGVALDVTERRRLEDAERTQRELAVRLAATSDLDEGLRLCLEAALRCSGLDAGGVYLRDEVTGALDLAVHAGLSAAFVAETTHYPGDSPNARFVAANRPHYLPVGSAPPGALPAGEGLRFLASIPLTGDRGPVGCMNIASHTADDLAPGARAGLEAVAAAAGNAVARLRAQATLREREEIFATLASQAMDAVALVDLATGRFVEFNTAAHEGLGYTRDEFATLTVHEVEAEHSAAEIRANVDRLVADGRLALETRHRCKDGSLRDAEVRGKTVRVRGRDYGAVVWTDVTDRKRASDALQRSEARLASLFRSSPVGVVVVEVSTGRVVEVSDRFCAISGFERAEVVGRAASEAPFWIDADERDRVLARVRTSDRAQGIEARVRRRSGEPQTLELWAELVDLGGEPHVLIAGADVTERKRVEHALRESEESFRALTEAAPDGIFVHHAGRFVYVNDAMARMVGAPRAADLVGREVLDFVAPEHREGAGATVGEVGGQGGRALPLEHEWVRLDGSRFPAEGTGVALRFQGLDARLVFVRDRTAQREAAAEQEKLREQLQQSQKMESIGRLAGGVAHDFNNLLMVQLGHCEMLRDDLRDDDPLAEPIAEIEAAAQRAASLTRQLLAFSRKQPLRPQVIEVNDLLRGLAKMLARLLGEDVALTLFPSPEAVRVEADPGQLEQVFVNLAVNARDAMPGGGRLTIEVSDVEIDAAYAATHADVVPGRYVRITVSDTGTGMDEETKRRVFEPFFTTKEKGKGTGLGLATVYGIVKQSGGHVGAYSELGHGTTFKVYLPRADGPAQPREARRTAAARGLGEVVLVVEDDPALRGLVVRLLASLGYRGVEAAGSGEAVARVEREGLRPDVVITDVVMPGMNGRALVDRLRATLSEVPAIFMSGYTDSAIVHHGVLDEGVRFLQKPFAMGDLAAKLREALAGR